MFNTESHRVRGRIEAELAVMRAGDFTGLEGGLAALRVRGEQSDCSLWRGTGPDDDPQRWYRACMTRATDRFVLCMKGAGTMPPPWSAKDVE